MKDAGRSTTTKLASFIDDSPVRGCVCGPGPRRGEEWEGLRGERRRARGLNPETLLLLPGGQQRGRSQNGLFFLTRKWSLSYFAFKVQAFVFAEAPETLKWRLFSFPPRERNRGSPRPAAPRGRGLTRGHSTSLAGRGALASAATQTHLYLCFPARPGGGRANYRWRTP